MLRIGAENTILRYKDKEGLERDFKGHSHDVSQFAER